MGAAPCWVLEPRGCVAAGRLLPGFCHLACASGSDGPSPMPATAMALEVVASQGLVGTVPLLSPPLEKEKVCLGVTRPPPSEINGTWLNSPSRCFPERS